MITVIQQDVQLNGNRYNNSALMGVQTTAKFVEKTSIVATSSTSTTAASTTGGSTMQKSKSSSSVMHHGSRLVAKKIFRSRSKSQTRPSVAQCSWTPQGSRLWTSASGKQVILNDTNLLQLGEVERKVLQKVALAKLQALNLGVAIKVPSENPTQVVSKPKRRPYLLRKARTTSIFDASRKEVEKENSTSGGLVFGIPLSQCVENDRLSRGTTTPSAFRNRGELSGSIDETTMGRNDSRASFSSLIDPSRVDEKGSCENLLSRGRIAGSVPGLLDRISTSSAADITASDVNSVNEEPSVPNILTACIRHLENNGLHTLGIFRVSASKKRIRQLREEFDCGKETTLEEEQCPHDVATLMKEYLRDLPDPLLCKDLYQAFVQTQRIRHRKLQFEALQHLVQLLPPTNRDTLWTLLNFLDNVAKNSNDSVDERGNAIIGNRMDSINLATVFAPNILHCIKTGSKENPNDRIEDRTDVINVIRTLIEYNRELFYVPAELLDEVYIHMMDSHPECLDEILNKKESYQLVDESQDDIDSESNSTTWTPNASSAGITFEHTIKAYHLDNNNDGRDTPPERKKTYSREECLHETAATGGPNVAMRIRHKDRIRERSMKKKREESAARKRKEDDSPTLTRSIISRFRGQKDEDGFSKMRSASLESSSSHADGSEIARALRISDDPHTTMMPDRRKSSPYISDASGVITASLTIPVQNQALSVVDDDIQYIDDGTIDGKQQMTIGLMRASPAAPPRRRQRSISGSDSSIASNVHQAVTGYGQDSAIGSSATYSSPPHNTTPSSLGSDHGAYYSSPPSWASSPPTSPDSFNNTSMSYNLPDDVTSRSTRIPVQRSGSKEMPTLQKVSIVSTSELQQVHAGKPATSYQRSLQINNNNSADVQKSYSSPSFSGSDPSRSHEQKFTPSITSIGNAVLRSRTADFERISGKPDGKPAKTTAASTATTTTTPTTTSSSNDKKKYTKRRYTDSRHPTQHIPDSQTLEGTTTTNKKKEEKTTISQTVYKRRELISSVPTK